MTSKGATIDVGAWLQDLGLGQYDAISREKAINEKVLPNLTAEDLKDMGIGIVGHRRLLLDVIAVLRTGAARTARSASFSCATG
jgi:SAM domain (Sterile alpha motif)